MLQVWGLGTAMVTAASIDCLDIPLALFFNQYIETWWSLAFRHITDVASGYIWYPVAVAGLIAAFVRHKRLSQNLAAWSRESRAWIFMIVTMATSGTFINLVKILVQRERPRLLFRDGTFGFHPFSFDLDLKDCSFPSGHTQSIWSAMLCLGFIAPPLRPLLFTVAVLVSASRVVIGAHYAGDVFAGMYVAFFAALMWRQWFEKGGVSVTLWPKRDAVSATAA
jgi:membrane-associated phospholipid phosphatase